MVQCTATSKRTGQRCGAQAITGRKVCRHHGGKSLAGPAHPNWVDGGRSHVLPKRLMADYQASLADSDKLVLNKEIALIDARMADLLRRVDSGESGQLWALLRQTWREYEAARKANDTIGLVQAITTLGEIITRGHHDAMAWTEVTGLVERRRKLVESERKRLVEAQQVVAVEQAAALLGLMVDAVQRHVRDDAILGAIVDEYARLVGRPVPVEAPPALPAGKPDRRAG